MRVLNELIGRTANQDDECKGRFKSQTLLNEAAVNAELRSLPPLDKQLSA